MSGGKKLDEIQITLRSERGDCHDIWIDVANNSLSQKWLASLNALLINGNHLEKNYC